MGLTLEFHLSGERGWASVAVQKWEGRYKVHVDEMLERNAVAELYERDESHVFDAAEVAALYVDEHTRAKFVDLRPCKGQRLFNPALEE